jgi:hypothetical protein
MRWDVYLVSAIAVTGKALRTVLVGRENCLLLSIRLDIDANGFH